MVALLATGGSTNHLIHWVAVARAAGIVIDWTDFSDLSGATPLLARVYPNGVADVNQFQSAGGPGFVIRELIDSGSMHGDVATVVPGGLRRLRHGCRRLSEGTNGKLSLERLARRADRRSGRAHSRRAVRHGGRPQALDRATSGAR